MYRSTIQDSFLNDLSHNVYNQSLSDVVGYKLSQTLEKMKISTDQNVDIKELFVNTIFIVTL